MAPYTRHYGSPVLPRVYGVPDCDDSPAFEMLVEPAEKDLAKLDLARCSLCKDPNFYWERQPFNMFRRMVLPS